MQNKIFERETLMHYFQAQLRKSSIQISNQSEDFKETNAKQRLEICEHFFKIELSNF